MNFEERRFLREKLIRDLYNHYFESAGRELMLTFNLDHEEDKEKHLTYQYWEGKGLINYRIISKDGLYAVKINSYGIDYVEK
ncbi:hypothetical protein CK938_03025 [Bacillus cereus]|uniref:hypothetical protein n=1 Tax=Bacillus paranthracis TaxID=2026186 RepID=UPI000BAF9519|nr:hypothetical protein [Bacillus paranthracis]ASZ15652.1 hypothetical protein CK938_03025 [Bacillus cereus]